MKEKVNTMDIKIKALVIIKGEKYSKNRCPTKKKSIKNL